MKRTHALVTHKRVHEEKCQEFHDRLQRHVMSCHAITPRHVVIIDDDEYIVIEDSDEEWLDLCCMT